MAEMYPDKTAVIQGKIRVSYGELNRESCRRALWLRDLGINAGDIVGILVSDHLEFIYTMLALLRLAVVAAPLSRYYQTKELIVLCRKADIKLVISDNENCHKLSGTSVPFFVYDEYGPDDKETACGNTAAANLYPDDPVIFLMTSGSTGSPKIASISQAAMKNRLDVELETFNLDQNDRMMISTPLYHSLAMRMIMTALYSGMTLVLLKGFTACNWVSAVESERVTYTISVPVQLQAIADYCERNGVTNELDSVRTLLSTSAPLLPEVRDRMIPYIKGEFYNFIASSETEFIARTNCKEQQEKNVLGYPFPGVSIRIKKDSEQQGDDTGEILCWSGELLTEYYNDRLLTQEKFDQGYFCTGDRGYIDEKGCLYYAGRKKNTIICSGVNIYPEDIENEILKNKKVRDCYVFGAPDRRCGEKVVLLVTGDDLNERELKAYCLSRLSIFQQPRIIRILHEIPRDDLGKIRKEEILKLI